MFYPVFDNRTQRQSSTNTPFRLRAQKCICSETLQPTTTANTPAKGAGVVATADSVSVAQAPCFGFAERPVQPPAPRWATMRHAPYQAAVPRALEAQI